jgi:hypothetical protein
LEKNLKNGVDNMNQIEAPRDEGEILRLLREQDSLGAESSLWLRVFRQLTESGKPIGQILVFTIPIGNEKKLPVGMLTLTDNNRLVFWPVLPRGTCVVINKPRVMLPDHITVEFPSEKVHVTSYDADGRPIHVSEAWRSSPHEEQDFRLLFTFLVRLSIVVDQDIIVSRKVTMPINDKNRRTAEISRCIAKVLMINLPLPGKASENHYAGFFLYRASYETTAQTLPSTLFPSPNSDEMIKDWPHDADFPIVVSQFQLGNQRFCLAGGFPPGHLKDELCFGFPRRQRNGQGGPSTESKSMKV